MRRPPSLAHHLGRWFIPFGMNQLRGKSRTGQRPTRRPGPHEGPPKREREVRPTDEGPAYGVCIHISLSNSKYHVSVIVSRRRDTLKVEGKKVALVFFIKGLGAEI